MSPISSRMAAGILIVLTGVWQARAVTWQLGSGTWDDSATTHWNPAAVPGTGTVVNLTQSSAPDINITYAATSQTAGPALPGGTYYGDLTVSNATGPTTLYLDGTDSLPANNVFVNTGGTVNISGSGTLYPQYEMYLYGGTVTQSGGTVSLRYYDLNLYPGAGKTATYNLSGGTLQIPGNRALEIGSHNYMADPLGVSVFNLSGTGQIMGQVRVGRNAGGATMLNQTGGSINTTGSRPVFRIRADGAYNLSGGSNWNSNFEMEGGSFTQSNGTFISTYDANICRTPGYTGTATLSGGTMSIRNLVLGGGYDGYMPVFLGGSGNALLSGGTLTLAGGGGIGIYVSHPSAVVPSTLTLKGTTLAGGAEINVFPLGTFQGYGTVGIGAGQPLKNSGRIIADGGGVARTLDFSSYTGTLSNPTDNASNKGWFAVNQGKLLLPSMAVAAGASTKYWGEDTAAEGAGGVPDLVNSVKLDFHGVNAGTLTGSLLATDRADAYRTAVVNSPTTPGMYAMLACWDLGLTNFTAGNVDLTLRYDNAVDLGGRDPNDLKILHYNNSSGQWDILNTTISLANFTAYTTGVTSFSPFALAMLPEPAAGLLLALASGLVALRRGRRSARFAV